MPVRVWLAAIGATLTACASTPPPVGTRDLLDVVQSGAPRTAIVLKLGPPFAMFEGERILAWSIGQDAGGYFVGVGRSGPAAGHPFTRYELVIVFDGDGRVAKHSLVEVHKAE